MFSRVARDLGRDGDGYVVPGLLGRTSNLGLQDAFVSSQADPLLANDDGYLLASEYGR